MATFQRENPPTFKGKHDPDGELEWLKEIERIFRVMDCILAQKVRYGTHMLAVEADDWWLETCQRLEAAGENVTWAVFCKEFLRKYFPEDVRGKEEIEFLELSLLSWLSFTRTTARQMLIFQSASSLRTGYAQRSRRQLDTRRFVSLLI